MSCCTVVGLVATACSGGGGGGGSADLSEVVLTVAETAELPVASFGRLAVSSDGTAWAVVSGTELCVVSFGEASICREVEPVDPRSLSVRTDPLRVLANDDLFTRFIEPDVIELDAELGEVVRLTDDGIDSLSDEERADVDVVPFVGPDGGIHLFRDLDVTQEYEFAVHRLAEDGSAEPVEGLTLEVGQVPLYPPRPVGGDRFVVSLVDFTSRESIVALLDLDAGSVETLDTGSIRDPQVVDTAPGLVLVADRFSFRALDDPNPFWLIDLEGEVLTRVTFVDAAERTAIAAGLGPDGSFVVVAAVSVFGRGDAVPILVGRPIEDGALGELVTIAEGDDFLGVDEDGDPISPVGAGFGVELVWSDDGRLVMATSEDELIAFETSG